MTPVWSLRERSSRCSVVAGGDLSLKRQSFRGPGQGISLVPVRVRLCGLSVVHVGGGLRVSSRVALYWRLLGVVRGGGAVCCDVRYHCAAGQWLSAWTQVGEVLGGGELSVAAVVQGLLDLLALVRGGAHRACNSRCMVHLRRAFGAARRPFQPLLVFSGWQFPLQSCVYTR